MGMKHAITAAVLVLSSMVAVAAGAQDTVRSSFLTACAKDIMDANPVWSEPQLAQMCECRYELLGENFSRDDIVNLTYALDNNAHASVPEPVTSANLEYVLICLNRLKEGR